MTTQEAVAATTPLAMYAIASHMLDRGLPAPISIDSPVVTREQRVRVAVHSVDLDVWLDSMLVDDESVAPASTMPGWVRASYVGRIPVAVGDVAVTVVTVTKVGSLALAPDGAA